MGALCSSRLCQCLPEDASHWAKSQRLVAITLFLWLVISQIVPAMVDQFNEIRFLAFRMGFWWGAQGIMVGFVVLLFWFNYAKNKVDGYYDQSMSLADDEFMKKLHKIYGWYAGGFFVFVVFLGLLELAGVPDQVIGYLFVMFTILVYAGIGIMARTNTKEQYYVAGHQVPAIYNGMATGADWMSGASFVAMAGKLYTAGYDGLAFVVGWTGGYLLVATLIAPYLRKFKAFTVPEFLGQRYGGTKFCCCDSGTVTRVIGILVLISASFSYLTAQAYSTGIIMSRFLGLDLTTSCFIGLAGILFCSMLGGMRAVTWTQVAQYIVLIVAYMIPVFWMAIREHDIIIPQLDYGTVLRDVTALEVKINASCEADDYCTKLLPKHDDSPASKSQWWALTVCLMMGTASLPHILMRYFTTPSVKEARESVSWSLFFIFLLYFTAPAYAVFAKWNIYTNIIGAQLKDLPEWVYIYSRDPVKLLKICGAYVPDLETLVKACQTDSEDRVGASIAYAAGENALLRHTDFEQLADAIVIATPEANGLPYVIAGLVAAGGLAAALSTADGLLLSMANSLSHDLFYNTCNPNATEWTRLLVSRTLLVIIAVVAAAWASQKPEDILSMVAWAFSIAASGNFPALFLGVWWRRTTGIGAIFGSAAGYLVCMCYIFSVRYGEIDLWLGVPTISAGIFGVPVGMIVTILVSLITPAPSEKMMKFIDSLREPETVDELMGKGKSEGEAGAGADDAEKQMTEIQMETAGGDQSPAVSGVL